jgi:CheY-like chemotaxis protein
MPKRLKKSTKKRILIVEDELLLSDAYNMILAKQGYEVRQVNDGQEALQLLVDFTPDLVLLDLRMPRMDGIEFLTKAKLKTRFPNTKVVIFSNYDEQSEIDRAYKLGAHRYILKAWAAPKELVRFVAETLEQ